MREPHPGIGQTPEIVRSGNGCDVKMVRFRKEIAVQAVSSHRPGLCLSGRRRPPMLGSTRRKIAVIAGVVMGVVILTGIAVLVAKSRHKPEQELAVQTPDP